MAYKVRMNSFEGPFDLLVYLIETAEMSIYDIEVSLILKQYLEYVSKMDELDVTMASEFMVLAATLIEIKSKMLLPRISDDREVTIEEDPRKTLVSQIVEYKKYKKTALIFSDLEDENKNIYEKPREDISHFTENPEEFLKMDIGQFVQAFNAFILKKQRLEEMERNYQRIERDRLTIDRRIVYIDQLFEASKLSELPFSRLLTKNSKYDAAVTFVSILEMIREHRIDAIQKKPFDEIIIKKLAEEERLRRMAIEEANKRKQESTLGEKYE